MDEGQTHDDRGVPGLSLTVLIEFCASQRTLAGLSTCLVVDLNATRNLDRGTYVVCDLLQAGVGNGLQAVSCDSSQWI